MKRPKTKGTPAAPTAPQPAATPADVKHPYGLPTPEQIANLAATLARRTDENPTLLAFAALKLWQAAETVHLEASEYYLTPDAITAHKAALPILPMTRDEFLRMALPNARPEDREAAWKHYNLALAGIDPSTSTADQDKAARTQWESPTTPAELVLAKISFLPWWNEYHAQQVTGVRRTAALIEIRRKAALPSFPMTRDEFLHRMLPKARPKDRDAAWKDYDLALAGIDPGKATAGEQGAARLKWESPTTPGELVHAELSFREWWKEHHAAEVSKARSSAGSKAKARKSRMKVIADAARAGLEASGDLTKQTP